MFAANFEMKRPVLFIDEFEKTSSIYFLRTLAKSTKIPCILSSTNAKISNMIIFTSTSSGATRKPWCKVITRLPPCSFNGVIAALSITIADSISDTNDAVSQTTDAISDTTDAVSDTNVDSIAIADAMADITDAVSNTDTDTDTNTNTIAASDIVVDSNTNVGINSESTVAVTEATDINTVSGSVDNSSNPSITLSDCFIENRLNIEHLFSYLKIKDGSMEKKQHVSFIFDLIRRKSSTCLQGTAFFVIEILIQVLKSNTKVSDICRELLNLVTSALSHRKPALETETSLYFSISSFSLTGNVKFANDIANYDEGPASVSVNNNLYFFGKKPDPKQGYKIAITLDRIQKKIFEREVNTQFTFTSYLPNFEFDIFTHMALWNLINVVKCPALEDNNVVAIRLTLAKILKLEHEKISQPSNAEASKANHDFQEHLALLAIANASHQSFDGSIDGVSALKEFAIQVQVLSNQIAKSNITKLKDIPPVLKKFLSGIKLPYLIPQKFNEPDLENLLGNLVQTGVCKRLKDSEGIDISFEIRDRKSGYIECKNLKDNVSRSHVKKYALRAIKNKSPMTILLVNTAGSSIRSQKEFNSFSDNEKNEESAVEKKDEKETLPETEVKIDEKEVMRHGEEVDEKETVPYKEEIDETETVKKSGGNAEKVTSREPNQKKTKTESERVFYSFSDEINRARIKDHSIPKDFDLNVYTLAYKDTKATDSLDFNFVTLHEVEGKEPDGVFIIIESNAKFN